MGNICEVTEAEQRAIAGYDKDIGLLLVGINNTMAYPQIRYGTDPEEHDRIADIQLNIMLTQVDIVIGIKNTRYNQWSDKEFEAKYFARILALNCYEIFMYNMKIFDLPLNKYRSDIKTSLIMRSIDLHRKMLKEIYKQENHFLYDIRHNLIAHRKGTAFNQNKSTKDIDIDRVLAISSAVLHGYIHILMLLPELQRAIGLDHPD